MRFLFGLLAAVPVLSAASFEMVMIADNGDATNPGRIHRYDPVSGAYLGAFGLGDSSSWRAMAINPAVGELYTGTVSAGGTVVYDYNTGLPKRHITANSATLCQFFDPTSGKIGIPGGTFASSVNVATGAENLFNFPSGTSMHWGVTAPDGSVYWGDAIGDRIYRGSNASVVPTLVGSLGSDRISTNYVTATTFTRSNGQTTLVWPTSDLTNTFNFVSLSNATTLSSNGTITVTAFSVIRGVAPAHVGFYLLGRTPAAAWGLQHVRPDLSLGRFISLTQIKGDAFDMVGVVAPEPGTMLALGAGLCAMLRRRK